VRILIFHGYLLGGTGSNVYNARLAEALVRLGHEVHLLCQERHPDDCAFVAAAGDWDSGALHVRELAHARNERGSPALASGSCTVYRPDIGGLLPVYVADRYEGVQARTFAQCSEAEIASYVERNVAAVRELRERVRPDLALANHLVMGPLILARGLGGEVPYAVKVHGSALEYTVKPEPERFLPAAREGLAQARAVLVGSHHTASSLWLALEDATLPTRTRLGPPGVDVERFAPRSAAAAAAALAELTDRLLRPEPASQLAGGEAETGAPSSGGSAYGACTQSAFARDSAAAGTALAALDPERDRLVAFVGKLIVSKGVDLLLAAWPLVLAREPAACLVVVGFGAYRDGLQRLIAALSGGDLDAALELAHAGRTLEGENDERPLRYLMSFLASLQGSERERYLDAAAGLPRRVVLTGRLDHEELADLLPACEALVVPSTFPEAFGMVAAEAAACGVLPVSAAHSGLAEVSDELARALPAAAAAWLSFAVDDNAVRALAARLLEWLAADPQTRSAVRAGLVETVRERWSWEGVARGVIAAARGELELLSEP